MKETIQVTKNDIKMLHGRLILKADASTYNNKAFQYKMTRFETLMAELLNAFQHRLENEAMSYRSWYQLFKYYVQSTAITLIHNIIASSSGAELEQSDKYDEQVVDHLEPIRKFWAELNWDLLCEEFPQSFISMEDIQGDCGPESLVNGIGMNGTIPQLTGNIWLDLLQTPPPKLEDWDGDVLEFIRGEKSDVEPYKQMSSKDKRLETGMKDFHEMLSEGIHRDKLYTFFSKPNTSFRDLHAELTKHPLYNWGPSATINKMYNCGMASHLLMELQRRHIGYLESCLDAMISLGAKFSVAQEYNVVPSLTDEGHTIGLAMKSVERYTIHVTSDLVGIICKFNEMSNVMIDTSSYIGDIISSFNTIPMGKFKLHSIDLYDAMKKKIMEDS